MKKNSLSSSTLVLYLSALKYIFFFKKTLDSLPKNHIITGWVQSGRGQSNPSEPGFTIPSRSWDEPLSVASLVIQSSFTVPPLRDATSVNPSNRLDEGSTLDRGSLTPAVYLRLPPHSILFIHGAVSRVDDN